MTDFNNLKTAFKDKSNYDLDRAYILFKTMSNPLISKLLTYLVKFALYINFPINRIIKGTIYKHFCGGVTINDSQKTIDKLWASKIGTILDFSAEGKKSNEDFDIALNETIASIKKAGKEKSIPFAVFKPTGLTRFNLLEKINSNEILTNTEKLEKKEFEIRFEKICKTAHDNKVPVLIDAEESWIQDAIDEIAIKMMQKFNTNQTYIYNTIQFYRHDRLEYLKTLISSAKKYNFFVGIKLVRGAYHEKEIERAKEKGYKSPVHLLKENTDKDYNQALKICILNIKYVSICAGTHNEESSLLLIKLLEEYNISKKDKRIYLSQLLGMSDNISYNAANSGFNVVKYVPYGPVKDVLPYLIRRAEENTSISGQMGRELTNIIKEKKRRKYS